MTPKLVSWSGALTDAGQQLVDHLDATGATLPPAPAGSLITPAAHYFAALTADDQATLWARFQDEKAHSGKVLT